MASNPSAVTCTKDAWVKVADSVLSCTIHIMQTSPSKYLHTYRVEDDPAPTNDNDAVPFDDHSIHAEFDDYVDIYVKAVGAAGKVRLDS